MFYTIEIAHRKSQEPYYQGGGIGPDASFPAFTHKPNEARTYSRFSDTDADAQYIAMLIGEAVEVVRYDGEFIASAKRLVVEVHNA